MFRFMRDVKGNVGIMLALAVVPLLIGLGAAIDMVRANNARAVLQGAADAAAIAGATSGSTTSAASLKSIVEQYLTANKAMSVLQTVTNVSQSVDATKATFTVSISGSLNTTFMALAGIPQVDISASSEVNMGMESLEVAMALDNTGSMSGQKIIDLRTSAKLLVSTLEGQKSTYSTLKFGLVPFTQYVNVGTSNAGANWLSQPFQNNNQPPWKGCVGSRNSPFDESLGVAGGKIPGVLNVNCPAAAITPLTSDTGLIKTQIDTMVANGSTYIPAGLYWGWNVLDSEAPFTEGMTKTQLKAVNGHKVLVLMTDGWNTSSPTYPAHDGTDSAYSDAKLTTLCNNVKNDDIELFTVAFQVPSQSMTNLLASCASGPDHAFDASNGAALQAAFTKIGLMMSAIRLTK